MKYEGIVYRPPSEAYSLIIQATIGCAHNKCSFCDMYKGKKFRIRELQEIYEDLYEAREKYSYVERIFLADGDALVISMENLIAILLKIKQLFPECKRISAYSTPKDILRKSAEDLIKLKNLGIGMLYMGIESGSDEILKKIQKGITSSEIIEAGQKLKKSGIKLSVTFISGIGGKEKSIEHARESARVINAINPDYVGLLTLRVKEGTQIQEEVNLGKLKLLTTKQIILETEELIKNIVSSNCVLRSNHASNYLPLAGTFPEDKENLLNLIHDVLNGKYIYR